MSRLFKSKIVYIVICLSVLLSLVGGVFAMGESPIEYMSHADFTALETDKAWTNPEYYLGYTAQFNSIEYFDYRIGNMVDGIFVEYTNNENIVSLSNDPKLRNIGQNYKVKLVDYYQDSDDLWYKVEALEGYTLPQEMVDNPYILYLDNYKMGGWSAAPTLYMLPRKAMLKDDVLTLKKDQAAATREIKVDKEYVPDFFDVTVNYNEEGNWYGYDLGDVSSWNEELITSEYRYVDQESVILIPADVTIAFEKLLEAETYEEYNEILNSIPNDVLEQFTSSHMKYVEEYEDELKSQVIVEFKKTISINGKEVPITVSGNILGDYELSIEHVSIQTILDEGFDIDDVEDIILGLDIKIVDAEGNEWQPTNEQNVTVSIGVSELGIEDGTILRLDHKHEDEIYVFDELIVMNGTLTVNLNGFSIYVVQTTQNPIVVEEIINNGSDTIYIGQEIIYYNTNVGNNNNRIGTWSVEDPSGAIYYTVHSNTRIGNGGMTVPWIKIIALKETTTPVKLTYTHYNNNQANTEVFDLHVITPKATGATTEYENDGKRLYIKDTVIDDGTITAALVDMNGNEIPGGLDGAAFSWERDDGLFIVPQAYRNDYKSVDIARDHGGLVESRKKFDNNGKHIGYQPITYTLTATLSDGTILKNSYTVYHQSEIINASFEFPIATEGTYTFFPNGYPELYWKTTAPGKVTKTTNYWGQETTQNNLTKDIEYGSVVGGDSAPFNVAAAADGVQFAELNAEAFGALYQDIITVPSGHDSPEYIDWNFSHAARDSNDTGNVIDNMFVVFGPTEQAQKLLTQDDLSPLGEAAKNKARQESINNEFLAGTKSVKVTYERNGGSAEYEVWYHSAESVGRNETGEDWSRLYGSYQVPEGQYRTRIFFITDATGKTNQNYGNLIDISKAGQYKNYLVEYYVEHYENGQIKLEYFDSKKEIDSAIIYSSQDLVNFDYFEDTLNNYLHRIDINGNTYPYDIRYKDKASLYIENYPGTGENSVKPNINIYDEPNNNDYSEYDLVVQVYFRSTVVAVEKNLIFPSRYDANHNGIIEDNENGMTEEQKLTLMEKINADGGYVTDFELISLDNSFDTEYKSTLITNRDPAGNYKGYVAMGDNVEIKDGKAYEFAVREKPSEDPEGLVLSNVQFILKRYALGNDIGDLKEVLYEIVNIDNPQEDLVMGNIILGDTVEINGINVPVKIADLTVVNTYEEKMTTIHYQAVGNGKVAFVGDDELDFVDTPTEELAYYSGQAKGAAVHPGSGAVFVGWYKDAACTEENKVTAVDGVWDKTTNSFKPNANILNVDEVTFYAKFETSSVTIKRENGRPGQKYLYQVHVDVPNSNEDYDIYVSLACGEDGKGEVDILELGAGTYTVTELKDYTWRYSKENSIFVQEKQMPEPVDGKASNLIFVFTGERSNPYWVNEYADKKNLYTGAQ